MPEITKEQVEASILLSTKKLLGFEADFEAFDLDIKTHINTAFSTLFQAGVGPVEGFYIENSEDSWSRFIGNKMHINDVKSYVFLRVRMLFDKAGTSFAITADKEQIDELIWRLNVADDFSFLPANPTPATAKVLIWNLSNGIDFPAEAAVGDWGIDLQTGLALQKAEPEPSDL